MNKRGPVVMGIGMVMILTSIIIMFMVLPDRDPVFDDEIFIPDLFGDMFDHVTDEYVIFPGSSSTFRYSGQNPNTSMLWGIQITDFEDGDEVTVHISNIHGDDLDSAQTNEPVVFNIIAIENMEPYNFQVENTGDRPVAVVMMFGADPDDYDILGDPNSIFASMILPLVISLIMLMVGTIMLFVGIILSLVDWRRKKSF